MKALQRSFATLVALMTTTVYGGVQTYCPDNASQICYSVAVPSSSASKGSGNIYFQISAPVSNSWVALATGSQMDGANMFIMYQDGSGNVTISPRKTSRHNAPTLDQSASAPKLTLLAGSGLSSDGAMMVANVACANCQSWSGGTLSFTATSTNWISAWKAGNSLATTSKSAGLSQHDDYRQFGLDMTAAAISTDSNPFTSGDGSGSGSGNGSTSGGSSSGVVAIGSGRPSEKVLYAHGLMMAIVFVIWYPIASMLMPLLGKWQVHAGAQVLGFILMWVAFGLGVVAARERQMLFKNTHTLMGTVVVCLLVLQPFLGYAHHMYYVKYQKRGLISYVHIFWGQSLIVIGLVNGGLGLELASAPTSWVVAYAVVAAVIFTVYAVVKVFTLFRASHSDRRPRKEVPSPHGGHSPPGRHHGYGHSPPTQIYGHSPQPQVYGHSTPAQSYGQSPQAKPYAAHQSRRRPYP